MILESSDLVAKVNVLADEPLEKETRGDGVSDNR